MENYLEEAMILAMLNNMNKTDYNKQSEEANREEENNLYKLS